VGGRRRRSTQRLLPRRRPHHPLGWLLGAILIGVEHRLAIQTRPAILAGAAAFLWLVAVGVYFGLGQPGFYGDRLFVILDSQADVSAATNIQDYDARRRMVYTTLVEHAGPTQAPLVATLTQLHIGHTPYYLVNALEVRGGLPLRLWLERLPGVDRVLPSPVLRPLPWPLSVSGGVEPHRRGPLESG